MISKTAGSLGRYLGRRAVEKLSPVQRLALGLKYRVMPWQDFSRAAAEHVSAMENAGRMRGIGLGALAGTAGALIPGLGPWGGRLAGAGLGALTGGVMAGRKAAKSFSREAANAAVKDYAIKGGVGLAGAGVAANALGSNDGQRKTASMPLDENMSIYPSVFSKTSGIFGKASLAADTLTQRLHRTPIFSKCATGQQRHGNDTENCMPIYPKKFSKTAGVLKKSVGALAGLGALGAGGAALGGELGLEGMGLEDLASGHAFRDAINPIANSLHLDAATSEIGNKLSSGIDYATSGIKNLFGAQSIGDKAMDALHSGARTVGDAVNSGIKNLTYGARDLAPRLDSVFSELGNIGGGKVLGGAAGGLIGLGAGALGAKKLLSGLAAKRSAAAATADQAAKALRVAKLRGLLGLGTGLGAGAIGAHLMFGGQNNNSKVQQ